MQAVGNRFLTRVLLLCCSGICRGAVTDCDNCESNATACEISSSSMAIEVSTVCPVASLMRAIGRKSLSHTRFVALLQWNPSWRRTDCDNCESNATACELSSSSMAIEVSTVFPVASLMRASSWKSLSHTRFVTLLQWNLSWCRD